MGCMESIRSFFELKSSKTGQEIAELWPIYQWEVADSSEHRVGCMGFIWASFEPKISKIGQEMAELRPIYQWEVA